MIVKIKSNTNLFYLQFVSLLSTILNLRQQEIEVFARFLQENYNKKDIPKEDRFKLIFSTITRKQFMKELNLSSASFHNIASELRKKGLLTSDSIPDKYLVEPDNFELTYKFII